MTCLLAGQDLVIDHLNNMVSTRVACLELTDGALSERRRHAVLMKPESFQCSLRIGPMHSVGKFIVGFPSFFP